MISYSSIYSQPFTVSLSNDFPLQRLGRTVIVHALLSLQRGLKMAQRIFIPCYQGESGRPKRKDRRTHLRMENLLIVALFKSEIFAREVFQPGVVLWNIIFIESRVLDQSFIGDLPLIVAVGT